MKLILALLLTLPATAQSIQATPTDEIKVVSVQLIFDSVQAKYPGNEHIKQCGPDNHDGSCFDPKMRHIIARIYGISKERCEHDEGVACEELQPCIVDDHQTYEQCRRWVPIGKPVFEDKSEVITAAGIQWKPSGKSSEPVSVPGFRSGKPTAQDEGSIPPTWPDRMDAKPPTVQCSQPTHNLLADHPCKVAKHHSTAPQVRKSHARRRVRR